MLRAARLAAAAVAARLIGLRAFSAAAAPPVAGDGTMGDGMREMMSPDNMTGPMRTGMALFERHKLIRRTVTQLPDGIRAVTESDDPETAGLIQAHVGEMYRRLEQNRAFPYMMSRSVPALFANSRDYRRKLEATAKGVAVTETSEDPAVVVVIRAHAREIDGFVREGMPAMMRGMMR